MSQYLALQMNGTHARLLLASAEKNTVRVRHATEVSTDDAHGLAAKIQDTVGQWGCAGAKTLIALEREQCEIRRLEVPDVGNDELPDLARYQALQNFSALGPDWPLDFVTLPASGNPDEGKHLLAGAISPDLLKSIEETCEQIGCPLEGIILRPCATAAVIDQSMPMASDEGQVVVDVHQNVAELFVMVGPKTILMRTVRLPADTANATSALVPEIRRTIAAANSTLPNLKVSRIAVCGSSSADADIASALRGEAALPVVTVEDWAGAKIHKSLAEQDAPQNPSRYFPLIGLVHAEMAPQDSVIDFRRPRQRPPAPDNSRTYKLIALLAAVVLGVIFFGIRSMLKNEDTTIAFYQKQVNQNKKPVEDAEKLMAEFFEMENWYANSPNWLDELNGLTANLPEAEQVRLNEIIFNDRAATSARLTDGTDRGTVVMKGFLNQTGTFTAVHDSLQDNRHRVQSGDRISTPENRDYPWRFSNTVFVTTGLDDVVPATEEKEGTAETGMNEEAAVVETVDVDEVAPDENVPDEAVATEEDQS